MAASYDQIIAAVVARFKADTSITALLTSRTIGATTNGANNIVTGRLPDKVLMPCVILEDYGPRPAVRTMHENPMQYIVVDVDVKVVGDADALYQIQAEIDESMESANLGATAIADTADWTIKDVESAGAWTPSFIPKECRMDSTVQNPESRSKSFAVYAALK
jgi:hypothetical protein